MSAQMIKFGSRALLAVVLAIVLVDSASAVEVRDGNWEGRWYPGNSCRDTRERRVTAYTEGGHIRGEVHNPPSDPGVFAADIEPSGRFTSTVAGLKRFSISVNGRASPSEIRATWEGRDDCGTGNFVLTWLGEDEEIPAEEWVPLEPAAQEPETVEEEPEAATVQPDPTPQKSEPAAAPAEPAAGEPDSARAALETLRKQGVITEDEYQAKLKALEPEAPALKMAPSDLPPPDPRLVELDDLLTSGAISADEYLQRRTAITGGGN